MDKVTMRDVGLNFEGVSGACQSLDIALRDIYKSQAIKMSGDASADLAELLHIIKAVDRESAEVAYQASKARNLIRAITQSKLTIVGKTMSHWLEKDRYWIDIIERYGNPFDFSKTPEYRLKSINKIIEKSGDSSPKMNGLQLCGKALIVINVAVSSWQIGTGIDKIRTGDTGMGAVDVAEGSVNTILTIGTMIATKKGYITTAGGGWASTGAGLVAMAALGWAAVEARRAVRGQTPLGLEAHRMHQHNIHKGWQQMIYGKDFLTRLQGRSRFEISIAADMIAWPIAWLQTAGQMK